MVLDVRKVLSGECAATLNEGFGDLNPRVLDIIIQVFYFNEKHKIIQDDKFSALNRKTFHFVLRFLRRKLGTHTELQSV